MMESQYDKKAATLVDEYDTKSKVIGTVEMADIKDSRYAFWIQISSRAWRKFMKKIGKRRKWFNLFKLKIDDETFFCKIYTVHKNAFRGEEYRVALVVPNNFEVMKAIHGGGKTSFRYVRR